MTHRAIRLKQNDRVAECPRCGNNTRFKVIAEQVAEDCCETRVECRCGFDPTAETGDRFENVWGEVGNDAAMTALSIWNDHLKTKEIG